eukprot:14064223-Alexandrium_andersonii.AAC.1
MRSLARLAVPGPVRPELGLHSKAALWRPNAREQHREAQEGDSGGPVRPPRAAGARGRRTQPET